MVLPVVVRSSVLGAVTLVVLRVPAFAGWSARSRGLLCLLAAYLPSFLDQSERGAAPRRSACFSRLVRAIARRVIPLVFDVRPAVLEAPEKLAQCRQCILAVHPHGVLSLGHYLTFVGHDRSLESVLPQAQRSALGASVLFRIPIVREMALWIGCVDAGRATAGRCLRAGLSLSVVPGGEREQLCAQRGPIEHLVLRRRQGFVRLALQHGVPLVPVYCFGEAQLYYQSGLLMGFRSWLQIKLGLALVMPYGPFGIPCLHFGAPFRMVVGEPLELPRLPEPTQEEVDKHHQQYMHEVQALFERHKAAAGYGQVTLELV